MATAGTCLLGLFTWALLRTGYVVQNGVLIARAGLFRKRIPLSQITGIHYRTLPKAAMFGLGSDFIGIEYGEKAVNVSPKDVEGFVDAIRAGDRQ